MKINVLVLETFKYFGKDELYEEEFIKYFRDKGMSKEEIDKLWTKAHSMNIITIGAEPIWKPEHPWNIISHKIVFELVRKK